ncbi:mrpl-18, partial [Pristionchus pacificus]
KGMASKSFRFAASFVNRNPRNADLMGITRKPEGWQLERNNHLRRCIYRVELVQGKSQQVGRIIHHQNGIVLEASTTEQGIASQLYSRVDTSAALNIGRVLAQRCLQSGIHFVTPSVSEEERANSEHQGAFFTALEEGGLRLNEPEPIKQDVSTDARSTWRPFEVKHTREDKLDELPGYY